MLWNIWLRPAAALVMPCVSSIARQHLQRKICKERITRGPCRCFLADGSGQRLVSGANDKRVLLWDWTAALPAGSGWADDGGGARTPLLQEIEHGAKVNCVEAAMGGSGRQLLVVGGTQRRLSVYELR